jgi:NAD(P)H-nitrite reductase large subunit
MTSVDDIFVAGDVGDVEGSRVAIAEGQLAGLEAARRLGAIGSAQYDARMRKIQKTLSRARHSAQVFRSFYEDPIDFASLVTDDTILCRCEDVRAAEIKDTIEDFDGGLRGVKLRTRAGMGNCQGRICGGLVAAYTAGIANCSIESILLDTPRPPVKPVSIGAMSRQADH